MFVGLDPSDEEIRHMAQQERRKFKMELEDIKSQVLIL